MIIEIDGKKFDPNDFGYIIIYLSNSDIMNIMNMPKESHCYGIFNDKKYSVVEAKRIVENFAEENEQKSK